MNTHMLQYVRTIPLAKRGITKSGQRYFIYLPTELNDLWRGLHEKKVKVNVIIEIPG